MAARMLTIAYAEGRTKSGQISTLSHFQTVVGVMNEDLRKSGKRLLGLLRAEDERWKNTRQEALRLLQAEEEGSSTGKDGDAVAPPLGSALAASLHALQDDVRTMEERVRTLSRSRADLAAKIDKVRANLRRAEEREAELGTLRPSYSDEYEMLEDGLQDLHQAYVSRVRNVHYLQRELKKMDRREAKEARRAAARMMELRRKIAAEEAAAEPKGGSDGGGGDGACSGDGGSIGGDGTSDGSSSISSVAGARSFTDSDESNSAW
jgi:chromosome segregation ATPase